MKNFNLIVALISISFFLISCSPKKIEIPLNDVELSSPVSEYIEIDGKKAILEYDNPYEGMDLNIGDYYDILMGNQKLATYTLKIPVKLIKELSATSEGNKISEQTHLEVCFLEDNGMIISPFFYSDGIKLDEPTGTLIFTAKSGLKFNFEHEGEITDKVIEKEWKRYFSDYKSSINDQMKKFKNAKKLRISK